jgi:hypothetical protein
MKNERLRHIGKLCAQQSLWTPVLLGGGIFLSIYRGRGSPGGSDGIRGYRDTACSEGKMSPQTRVLQAKVVPEPPHHEGNGEKRPSGKEHAVSRFNLVWAHKTGHLTRNLRVPGTRKEVGRDEMDSRQSWQVRGLGLIWNGLSL